MERPIRILVVDEDAPARRLLSAALSGEKGYEIRVAGSPAEALRELASFSDISLVITDLASAEVSGLKFIEELRAVAGTIPLLVLTALQTHESVAKALEFGADDYLQKPVDLRELRRAVSVLLQRHARHMAQRADSAGAAVPPDVSRSSVRSIAEGTFVELNVPTDSRQAERFQRFAERLLAASLSEKERHNLHLALEEILRNAIEWGNNNDRSKQLRLSYCILPDRITFRIEDEGEGFDHAALKDPSLNPQKHISERRASGKRMGGWGVFLTRKLMDEVVYNEKGNVVFLTKLLRRASASSQTMNASEAQKAPAESPAAPAAETSAEAAQRKSGKHSTRILFKKDFPSNSSQS